MIEPTDRDSEMVREMLDEWLPTPGQAYISADAFRALVAGCKKLSAAAREEGRQEEREWQPIETAPRDGTRVLLWDGGPEAYIGYWSGDSWISYPSHWMPLPDPPVS
jgi:hypothetical protein